MGDGAEVDILNILDDHSHRDQPWWPGMARRAQLALDAFAAGMARSSISPGSLPRLVILESPYSGDVEANLEYARSCLHDCLERGEAPIASHLLTRAPTYERCTSAS